MLADNGKLFASGGIDYGPFPTAAVELTHTIPASSVQSLFGIQIREDTITETTETFTVELLLPSSSSPRATIGTVSTATVSIRDNDGKCKLGGGGD